ncbi:MAG: hypothetical protein ACLQSR_01350 [Limisphaerales bacterium]
MKSSIHKLALAITASILAACSAKAYELNINTNLPPIDFHGFASQGFLYSDDYNYLGDTTRGSFLFTEAGLNAAFNPFPRTRIAAQGFAYDVGQNVGKYDVVLDYASVEYTFNDYVGIRAGRIRRPEGIYNSIQDIDLARTFILLPQGIYDCRWRDFYVSLDGGELFGTIPMHKAGDLSYEVYCGYVNPQTDGGLGEKLNNIYSGIDSTIPYPPARFHLASFNPMPQGGLQLWWDTPLDGFRVGAMIGDNWDFEPVTVNAAGASTVNYASVPFAQGSLEYVWKNWTFQSEYFTYRVTQSVGSDLDESWYIDASYRFNKWAQAGVYYTESYNDVGHMSDPTQFQKDAALALRFDPTSWWIFKIEGHCIHGTGLLNDDAINPITNQNDRLWFMLALKTTVSF